MFQFELPVHGFRSVPTPYLNPETGKYCKLHVSYVRCEALPQELKEWMQVNPRIPRLTKKDRLQGPVARAIKDTLVDEPEKMAVRNSGIVLLAASADHKRGTDPEGVLTVTLDDKAHHGIANGGHTFAAIREVLDDEDNVRDAYVKLNVYIGLDRASIPDIAQGLNRSLQVDEASLANLEGTFSEIKAALQGRPGEEQIAYRQGDPGDVDIQYVLTLMGMLSPDDYPDHTKHPNSLFGQRKLVLETFATDATSSKGKHTKFGPLIAVLPDLLKLSDLVQQHLNPHFARHKLWETKGKDVRVGSAANKTLPAHFASGALGGKLPVGMILPAFAAFRANVNRKVWQSDRRLEWLEPNLDALLNRTSGDVARVLKDEFTDNRRKPAEVGRKEAAYRGCYTVLLLDLMTRGYPVSAAA